MHLSCNINSLLNCSEMNDVYFSLDLGAGTTVISSQPSPLQPSQNSQTAPEGLPLARVEAALIRLSEAIEGILGTLYCMGFDASNPVSMLLLCLSQCETKEAVPSSDISRLTYQCALSNIASGYTITCMFKHGSCHAPRRRPSPRGPQLYNYTL